MMPDQQIHEEEPVFLPHAPHDVSEIISLPEYVGDELITPGNRKNYIIGRLIDILVLFNHIFVRCILTIVFMCITSYAQTFVFIWSSIIVFLSIVCTVIPVMFLLRELIIRERLLTALARTYLASLRKETVNVVNESSKVVVIPVREYDSDNDKEVDVSDLDEIVQEDFQTKQELPPPTKQMQTDPYIIAAIHCIPSHVMPFTKSKMKLTTPYCIYGAILFEIITLQAFILVCVIYAVDLSKYEPYVWRFTSIFPLLTSVFALALNRALPFLNVINANELVQRTVWYNSVGLVLSRICLEQHERTFESEQGSNITKFINDEFFEHCHSPPCFSFDEIQSVHVAVSLETLSNIPYNQAWIYIHVKRQPSDKEYRVITPILTSSKNQDWKVLSVFDRLFESPLLDGLGVNETSEFLMQCLSQKRKDLFAMLGRVNSCISSLRPHGVK